MISFDRTICSDFEAASAREWLETNGIGGFASGTVSGANTRRYHGLLTAAVRPPLGRLTILSKFEETLEIDGEEFELSANQFPDVVSPQGYKYLKEFRLDPFPVWVYEVDGVTLEKRVFMVYGSNTTVCRWSSNGVHAGTRLIVKPLLSFADYHSLQHESAVRFHCTVERNRIEVASNAGESHLYLDHNAVEVVDTGYWYRNFQYAIEEERGFDHSEDLYQPFELIFDLAAGPATMFAGTEGSEPPDYETAESAEIERREVLIGQAGARSELEKRLVLAADQFVVARGSGHTVIAGYPWFSDWGRDTMIALNGLTLATGRHEIARGILLEFSRHISDGMLPNRFPDGGDEAEYNTVDATLWYFEAVRAYIEKTGDAEFIREAIYPKLVDIVAWHLRGTRYNIHVDTDGLLYAGSPEVQLTWMDAKIGDLVITPRTGKAVEIQALWYNALLILAGLADEFDDANEAGRYRAMADLCKLSFNGAFWNAKDECLYDVVENGSRDESIRPNQILAVSLKHTMLDAERSAKVLAMVEHELLTPVGLRSLAAGDPQYCPVYTGSPFERDSAYHQGTVWAWLIGPFVDAYRKVHGRGPGTEERVQEMMGGFRSHLFGAGVGQISEIFDAAPPHSPRGCPAQAWSVAEVLRVLRDE